MQGVIVGCDSNQEWLLPWWWSHYSEHNSYPVVFVDFEMSREKRLWCESRGRVVDLIKDSNEISLPPSPDKILWELGFGKENLEKLRSAWFKKPFALLTTPFSFTIWLDLDCEVRGNLAPLFTHLQDADIALVKEERPFLFGNKDLTDYYYNSGVIVFKKEAPILQHFANLTPSEKENHFGDQDLLSLALATHPTTISELPLHFNWDWKRGPNDSALICHYMGHRGKEILRQKL